MTETFDLSYRNTENHSRPKKGETPHLRQYCLLEKVGGSSRKRVQGGVGKARKGPGLRNFPQERETPNLRHQCVGNPSRKTHKGG